MTFAENPDHIFFIKKSNSFIKLRILFWRQLVGFSSRMFQLKYLDCFVHECFLFQSTKCKKKLSGKKKFQITECYLQFA